MTAALVACGDATGPRVCPGSATPITGSVCLDMSAAGGLVAHQAVIEAEVRRGIEAVGPLLDVSGLRIAVVSDPSRTQVIPEIGMGGFNPGPAEVRLYADPDWPDLDGVFQDHLVSILAHEIHHAMRRRAVGYGSTLLAAAVSEGLADHFSLEVVGGTPPPWSTALGEEELARWLPEVVARASGPYDHADWFLGTTTTIPRWTGYAVGFELVARFLERHPEGRASSLVGEPAMSFVPPGG